jgi:hypothetical protein
LLVGVGLPKFVAPPTKPDCARMNAFLSFVEFLVAIGVVVAVISNYLILNKLWKRRSVRDVTESISVSAALLGLATGVPFFIQFVLIDHSMAGAVKQAIGLVTGIIFVLIGSGLWVKDNRGRGFFGLFASAIRLEKSESADLLKSLVQPHGAEQILDILHQLAAIDRHLDQREIELIREFAARWRIKPPEMVAGEVQGHGELLHIRRSVVQYLEAQPPRDQAGELLDVILLFAMADSKVTAEEELVTEELGSLLRRYAEADEGDQPMYEVLIVPQNKSQVDAVLDLIPGTEVKTFRGGDVFSVGRFFSPKYAEVICEKYIALGLFTTQVSIPAQS